VFEIDGDELKLVTVRGRRQRGAVVAIIEEREKQDRKWGQQNHDPVYWSGILMEELGEVAKEAIEIEPFAERGQRSKDESLARLRKEVIQLAAVAVAFIEYIDRIPVETDDTKR